MLAEVQLFFRGLSDALGLYDNYCDTRISLFCNAHFLIIYKNMRPGWVANQHLIPSLGYTVT